MTENNDHGEQFVALTETIAKGLQSTLDKLWDRPDAAAVAEGFLAGDVRFIITRDTFEANFVNGPPPTDGETPFGMYL